MRYDAIYKSSSGTPPLGPPLGPPPYIGKTPEHIAPRIQEMNERSKQNQVLPDSIVNRQQQHNDRIIQNLNIELKESYNEIERLREKTKKEEEKREQLIREVSVLRTLSDDRVTQLLNDNLIQKKDITDLTSIVTIQEKLLSHFSKESITDTEIVELKNDLVNKKSEYEETLQQRKTEKEKNDRIEFLKGIQQDEASYEGFKLFYDMEFGKLDWNVENKEEFNKVREAYRKWKEEYEELEEDFDRLWANV